MKILIVSAYSPSAPPSKFSDFVALVKEVRLYAFEIKTFSFFFIFEDVIFPLKNKGLIINNL